MASDQYGPKTLQTVYKLAGQIYLRGLDELYSKGLGDAEERQKLHKFAVKEAFALLWEVDRQGECFGS